MFVIPVLCVEAIKTGLDCVRRELGLLCTSLLIHAYLSTITRNLWLHKLNHCITSMRACVVSDPLQLSSLMIVGVLGVTLMSDIL